MKRNFAITPLYFFTAVLFCQPLNAQQLDCNFKPPVFKIDFGNATVTSNLNIGFLSNYRQMNNICPDDGNYSFASFTTDCFNGDWITMTEDHTPGDREGRMMIVNASERPGTFFQYAAGSLTPGAVYEFSAWIVNICRTSSPCNPTPPSLSFIVQSPSGAQIAKFRTGIIAPTNGADWQRYYGQFTLPAGITGVVLRMNDDTNGGCGNDFAMDDIMLRECMLRKPEPVEAPVPRPVVPETKPIVKEPKPPVKATTPPLKKNIPVLSKDQVKLKTEPVKTVIKNTASNVPVPEVLLTRTNPVVKKIETEETEMLLELYDNGEIDGDTVTIYHNNKLVVARAGLSAKPVSFAIKVDKEQPHHELVMVADNLGSIPPNTSLMVITANGKRYEVFISSSEQQNAKIIIDLKEDETN